MDLKIRDATEKDFEAIYLLNKNGLGYDYDIEKTHQRLKHILENSGNKILVAVLDGAIVGYIYSADYECTYSDPLKNILALVVDEGKRGFGIGRALLSAVENWAKESGSSGVRLVSGINREDAHKFYLSCGYTDRKNQKNFIKLFTT